MAHRIPERFDRLTREDAPRCVGDGTRNDEGDALATALEFLLDREDCRLGIERVEDRFDEQQVDASVQKAAGLLGIGARQFGEGDVACARIVDVGGDRCRPGRRSHGASHKAPRARVGKPGAGAARNARGLDVHFIGQIGQTIVGLGDAGGPKGVGFDQVRAGLQILLVDLLNHLGAGEL